MLRSLMPLVFASIVILLSTGCLVIDQRLNPNTNDNVEVNVEFPSDGGLIEIDFYEAVNNTLGDLIKDISLKSGLAPLAKAVRPEEFEFRIWTNLGGLGDPKFLGVRSVGNENNAYYFDINRDSNSVKSRNEHLSCPKSGWDQMLLEVRSRLSTPKGLVRDPQFRLNRDEPLIVFEVLEKKDYRRVLYGRNTSFPDGKRLIEVCDYLSSEFRTDMECH